jgi:hypothetical protein
VKGVSPVVLANSTMSVAAISSGVKSAGSSVIVSVKRPVRSASSRSTVCEVPMELWRKP